MRRIVVGVAAFALAFAMKAQGNVIDPAGAMRPQLKIETGGASALHRSIVDAPILGLLFSVGDDRTVRVWRRSDLRLVDAWRVPDDPRNPLEGALYVAALSRDFRTLAVGGWTGSSFGEGFCIYLFDTATGEVHGRIGGLPESIGALKFSRDGVHLAVGLLGQGGLRIVKVPGGAPVAADPSYEDGIIGIDEDPHGDLFVVGLDGFLRKYDQSFALRGRVRLGEGRRAARVKVSPDGASLAVGFFDARAPVIYEATTGRLRSLMQPPAVSELRNMPGVAWSTDGRTLWATGDPGDGAAALYRYEVATGAAPLAVEVGAKRLYDLVTLADGSVGFTLEQGVVGYLRSDGTAVRSIANGILDFASGGPELGVSEYGKRVEIPLDASTRVVFDASTAALGDAVRVAGAPAGASANLSRRAPDWLKWERRETGFYVGSRPMQFAQHENLWTVASGPEDTALIGTEWALREVRHSGAMRLVRLFNSVVTQVHYVAARDLAIVTLSDGTVRWIRREDGRELLALFIHAETGEWVAWTPEGYYASSPQGDNLIGWQVSRGADRAADFYRASQFERLLYRPDVVRAALDDKPIGTTRGRAERFDVRDLATIAPPSIRVTGMSPAQDPARPGAVRLRFEARQGAEPMREFVVFVDDVPLTRSVERRLDGAERESLQREVVFMPTRGGAGTVRVEVAATNAIGVREVPVPEWAPVGGAPGDRGDLFVLAIGVQRFAGFPEEMALDYTVRDAQEVARFFSDRGAGFYRNVYVRTLTDTSGTAPTRRGIESSLDFVRQAGPDDTVVVFLASHGFSDARGNYYLAPADASREDFCALLSRDNPGWPKWCAAVRAGGDLASLVPWQSFFDALGASAGRRLLIVDTCEARRISGMVEVGSLRKRSAASRFSLLLASRDGEESQEYPAGRHGLFTFALLEALRGKADVNRDGVLSLAEVHEYLQPRIEQLRDPRLGPQTPQLLAPKTLLDAPLIGSVVTGRVSSLDTATRARSRSTAKEHDPGWHHVR